MSFGYVVLGFNSYPKRGEAAPSSLIVEDAAGNDDRFTTTVGGSATNDNDFQAPLMVSGGQAITFGFYSQAVGNIATYQWSILNFNDPEGMVSSFNYTLNSGNITGPTTANWTDLVATMAGSLNPGAQADMTLRIVATNSGGSTTKDYTLTLFSP